MRILHVSLYPTAGVPYLQCKALNRIEGIEAAHYQFQNCWHDYPAQFWGNVPADVVAAKAWAKSADVIHFHGCHCQDMATRQLLPETKSKPAVVTIHGAPERGTGRRPSRAAQLVLSTPDLCGEWPEGTWIPNAVFPDELPWKPGAKPADDDPIKVARSATPHGRLKNLEEFDKVGRCLEKDKPELVDYMTIGPCAWVRYNQAKRRCDIVLDHLQGYYGVVTIEALAQGVIPVISLLGRVRTLVEQRFGELPEWIDMPRGADDLRGRILSLAEDRKELRRRQASIRKFAVERMDPMRFAHDLVAVYERALTGAPAVRLDTLPAPT